MAMAFPEPSKQQAKILWISVTALAIAILLSLIGLLLWGLGWVINRLSVVLLPLAVAGVIAYLLDPLVDMIEEKVRLPRMRAIFLVFCMAVLLVLCLLNSFVPKLMIQTHELFDHLEEYTEKVESKVESTLEKWAKDPDRIFFLPLPNWKPKEEASREDALHEEPIATEPGETADHVTANQEVESLDSKKGKFFDPILTARLVGGLSKTALTVSAWVLGRLSQVASWTGLLVGLALVPIYAFYFLLEKKGIARHWKDHVPLRESQTKDEVVFVLKAINDHLIVFFRGQVLVALCVGILLAIGFSLIQLKHALLLGLMAGVLGIVPYLGVMVSLIPALLISVIQTGGWTHSLLVLLVFVLVQMAEGIYISPKIIGDRVGLHPLTVIIAVMTGTTLLGGIIGGILAIPLTAATKVLMFRYVWISDQKKKNPSTKKRKAVKRKRKPRTAI